MSPRNPSHNDPTELYRLENQLSQGSQFESSNVAQQQAFANVVLTLIPIGGVAKGAQAVRWASHGVRSSGFWRKGKWITRFRKRKGSSKFVKPPPTFKQDASELFYTSRHGYRKAHSEISRRIPLPRTRRFVDKWQGRAELITSPGSYLTRRAAGHMVPGGMITIGGIRYIASYLSAGSGPPGSPPPTDQLPPGEAPWIEQPRPPPSQPPKTGPAPPSPTTSKKSLAPGGWKRHHARPARSCPQGHYYSHKHRRCVKSKYSR